MGDNGGGRCARAIAAPDNISSGHCGGGSGGGVRVHAVNVVESQVSSD